MSFNSVVLGGRLGKDAEIRYTQSGKSVLEFSLATDSGWGENKTTDWHNCKMFGERAEKLAQFLTKGSQIIVNGRISYRQWDDAEGNKKTRTEIIVDNVSLFGGTKSEGRAAAPATPKTRRASNIDDDLPFD